MFGATFKPRGGHRIRRLWRRIKSPGAAHQHGVPELRAPAFASYEEHANHIMSHEDVYRARNESLGQMAAAPRPIVTRGTAFAAGSGPTSAPMPTLRELLPGAAPNWREGQACSACGLNSRMRASIHLMQYAIRPDAGTRIYLTEQVTALYHWVKRRHPLSVGSEYLRDGTPRGSVNAQGIRHEDLTALSFADESFDLVVSLEVMEHIPDFRRAFAECARVLVPGGRMLSERAVPSRSHPLASRPSPG